MYPEFIKDANTTGNYMAQISLTYALEVEQKHRDFYREALAALEADSDKKLAKIYYLSSTCGNFNASAAPSPFGISITNSKLFIAVTSLKSIIYMN